MKSIVILFAGTLVFFAACSKDDTPVAPGPGNSIIPLKVGNVWRFRSMLYDTTGAVTWNGVDSLVIVRDTVVNGTTWYRFLHGDSWLTNQADGIWSAGFGPAGFAPNLTIKYPANAGDSWDARTSASRTQRVTLASISIPASVPAGLYTCYEYRFSDGNELTEVEYLAPNVGIVAIDAYGRLPSGRVLRGARLELTSVTLK
jgi:hypothetical protein